MKTPIDEQKIEYDRLIEASDALGFAAFRNSITEQEYIDLYNSFERGHIMKQKALANDLEKLGHRDALHYGDCLVDAVASDDELFIAELLGELSESELTLVMRGLPDNVVDYVESIK